MKKYISAILINALLIQLAGCYSQREITYDEFYSLPTQQEANVITTDEKTIELYSDSSTNNRLWWKKEPDTLTVYFTHLEKARSTALKEVTDTFFYSKSEINKVYVQEYSESKTITAIVVTALLMD
jgi:hypothetical protein